MKDDTEPQHPPLHDDCARTRLAQGALAAVDVCRCGMLQLHIGALTLRLAPCALAELMATLGQAVAAQSARRFCDEVPLSGLGPLRERGKA